MSRRGERLRPGLGEGRTVGLCGARAALLEAENPFPRRRFTPEPKQTLPVSRSSGPRPWSLIFPSEGDLDGESGRSPVCECV